MNRDIVLKTLYSLLGSFQFFDAMLCELTACISKHGIELAVFNKLMLRLKQLGSLGQGASKLDGFERIDETIYSLHLQGTGFNIRILYAFLPNEQPVLLLAFHERSGHRRTDYTPHLDPAKERFLSIKEAYENE